MSALPCLAFIGLFPEGEKRGECGAPRGRGGGIHGVRGVSGGVPARGPGGSPDLCPPRAALAPCFHPPAFFTRNSASLGLDAGRRRPQAVAGNGGGVPGTSIVWAPRRALPRAHPPQVAIGVAMGIRIPGQPPFLNFALHCLRCFFSYGPAEALHKIIAASNPTARTRFRLLFPGSWPVLRWALASVDEVLASGGEGPGASGTALLVAPPGTASDGASGCRPRAAGGRAEWTARAVFLHASASLPSSRARSAASATAGRTLWISPPVSLISCGWTAFVSRMTYFVVAGSIHRLQPVNPVWPNVLGPIRVPALLFPTPYRECRSQPRPRRAFDRASAEVKSCSVAGWKKVCPVSGHWPPFRTCGARDRTRSERSSGAGGGRPGGTH